MADTASLIQDQTGRTDSIVQAIMQYFNSQQRQDELSALPNSVAAQGFSQATGNFTESSKNNAFDLAARGLTSGSQEGVRRGALNNAFQSNLASVEQQRQASIANNQMNNINQQNQALNQAFQNPYTQASAGALNQALGVQGDAASAQAQQQQQWEQLQAGLNQQWGQAASTPLNIWTNILNSQQQEA